MGEREEGGRRRRGGGGVVGGGGEGWGLRYHHLTFHAKNTSVIFITVSYRTQQPRGSQTLNQG